MKRKKDIKAVGLIPLAVILLTMQVYASDTTPYNWYCKNNDTHTPPVLDEGMKFVEKYDLYYVDEHAEEKDPVIYLTFDAGYENGNIEKILDVLKAHEVKGAFFILENLVKRAPLLVRRICEEGHAVCNHTATHPDMTKITDKELFSLQLTRLEKVYTELTGEEMLKVYRPPEGRFSEANLALCESLGYKTVLWSFAYADWDNGRQPDPEASLKKLVDHLHNGEILLLHPTSATNAAILDRFLCEVEREGYRVAPLEELWQ